MVVRVCFLLLVLRIGDFVGGLLLFCLRVMSDLCVCLLGVVCARCLYVSLLWLLLIFGCVLVLVVLLVFFWGGGEGVCVCVWLGG